METARDVVEDRCRQPVRILPEHNLESFMLPPDKWKEETGSEQRASPHKLLEVYVDDFCALTQTTKVGELWHITRALPLHS